jgi:hypothetical protein
MNQLLESIGQQSKGNKHTEEGETDAGILTDPT